MAGGIDHEGEKENCGPWMFEFLFQRVKKPCWTETVKNHPVARAEKEEPSLAKVREM